MKAGSKNPEKNTFNLLFLMVEEKQMQKLVQQRNFVIFQCKKYQRKKF